MKSQQMHQQRAARTFLNSVEPDNFIPQHLTTKALNDDSCWDEYEADFEEAMPGHDLSYLDDISCN